MFVRVTTRRASNKEYRSVQIVESYRDPAKGMAPRTRVLAHLGSLEALSQGEADNLIRGLNRILGREAGADSELLEARDFGHVYAVHKSWEGLKLDQLLRPFLRSEEQEIDPLPLVRLMVINRLCDPCSKLALLEWLEGVAVPGFTSAKPVYPSLLRAMDKLIAHKRGIEPPLARKFLSLDKGQVDLVLYDITSTYFEGERSIKEGDFRQHGFSRDQRPDRRQVVIGMVMTPEGLPLCHHVFCGSTQDKSTVQEVILDLKERFKLRRVIFVGDRGMLSHENLETILEEKLGFIVAHPLRRNPIAREVLEGLAGQFDHRAGAAEQFLVDERQGVRFIVAFDPTMAVQVARERQKRLKKADTFIQEALKRLQHPSGKGSPPTSQGTYTRIHDYLKRRDLLRYYELEVTEREVKVSEKLPARQWEEVCDGVLLLETTDSSLSPQQVVGHYKQLQELERGWRTLKSSLKLRPIYHWTERRIRAHIFLCVLALQVEWVMRQRLRQAGEPISVARALEKLRQIKAGILQIHGVRSTVLTHLTEEHKLLFQKLGLPLPRVKDICLM